MGRIRLRILNGQSLVCYTSFFHFLNRTHQDAYEIDFSKTLFTPSGIDIYIRSSPSATSSPTTEQRQELLEKVIVAVQGCKVGVVGELAKKGFQVPGVV
jgi:hypothetical protein